MINLLVDVAHCSCYHRTWLWYSFRFRFNAYTLIRYFIGIVGEFSRCPDTKAFGIVVARRGADTGLPSESFTLLWWFLICSDVHSRRYKTLLTISLRNMQIIEELFKADQDIKFPKRISPALSRATWFIQLGENEFHKNFMLRSTIVPKIPPCMQMQIIIKFTKTSNWMAKRTRVSAAISKLCLPLLN